MCYKRRCIANVWCLGNLHRGRRWRCKKMVHLMLMMMMTDDTVLIPVMMDAGEESAVRSGVTSLAYKSHEKNKNSVGKYSPTGGGGI